MLELRNLKSFWHNLLDGTQKMPLVGSDLKRLESSAELLKKEFWQGEYFQAMWYMEEVWESSLRAFACPQSLGRYKSS